MRFSTTMRASCERPCGISGFHARLLGAKTCDRPAQICGRRRWCLSSMHVKQTPRNGIKHA